MSGTLRPGISTKSEIDSDENRHVRTDHLKHNPGGRAARGGVATVASQRVKFLTPIGATVILACLTPQDYGLIGLMAIPTNFVTWAKHCVERRDHDRDCSSAPLLLRFYGEPRLIWITAGYADSPHRFVVLVTVSAQRCFARWAPIREPAVTATNQAPGTQGRET